MFSRMFADTPPTKPELLKSSDFCIARRPATI